jgi:H+/Cl- antiporter ClcA
MIFLAPDFAPSTPYREVTLMEYTLLDLQANPYTNPINIDQYMTVMFTVVTFAFWLMIIMLICQVCIRSLKIAILLTSPAKREEAEKLYKEICKLYVVLLIIIMITFAMMLSFQDFFPSNLGKGLLRAIHIEKTEVKK